MQMRKISLMLFSLALMFLLPVGILLSANGVSKAYATTYSYNISNLDQLEIISNDEAALAAVGWISISNFSPTKERLSKMEKQLDLIRKCPNLIGLDIDVPSLNFDASILNNLSKCHEIYLFEVNVNLKNVSNPYVTKLLLSQCKVSNSSGISGFSMLERLELEFVDYFDYSTFDTLTNLRAFVANHSYLDSQKFNNSHLEDLQIWYCNVENCGDLFKGLPNLSSLIIHANVTNADTKYFEYLPKLESLNIEGTFVTDISFLKKLTKLRTLGLPTRIDDLSVLYELPNLNRVEMEGYTLLNVDRKLMNYFDSKNIDISFSNNYKSKGDAKLELDYGMRDKLNKIILDFNFTNSTSDFEKIDIITKFVMDQITYKVVTTGEYMTSFKQTFDYNVGVCYDYAVLEETLLTLAGIDAYLVLGHSVVYDKDFDIVGSGGLHAWNIVWVDNEWYALDATWCDRSSVTDYKTCPYYMKKDDSGVTWQEYYNSDNKDQYEYAIFDLKHDSYGVPNKEKSTTHVDFEVSYLDYITIAKQPTKKHYEIGEELDLSGAVIEATYSDGGKYLVKLPSNEVTVTGFDSTTAGVKRLTLTYYRASTTLYVLIKQPAAVATSMYMSKPLAKTTYRLGEVLDLTGAEITVNYSDGSTKIISLPNDAVELSPFDNTSVGTKYITFTYEGKRFTKVVEVVLANLVDGDFVYDDVCKTILSGVSEEGRNKTTLTIPSGVKTIKSTFGNDTDLSKNPMNMVKVELPSTVSTIEEGAFKKCFALWIVKNDSQVKFSTLAIKKKYFINASTGRMDFTGKKVVKNVSNVAYYKPSTTCCVAAAMIDRTKTSVVLSVNTTHINQYAFYGSNIENVTIPKKVTEIGLKAFARCENLKKVTMSGATDNTAKLTSIKAYAFYGDKALTEIVIPSKVNFVGKYALYNTGLIYVTVKNTNNWMVGTTKLSATKMANKTTAKTYFTKTYASKDIVVKAA